MKRTFLVCLAIKKTQYISQKKTKPSKRFLTSWAYLPFKIYIWLIFRFHQISWSDTEEKRKMHKQDTRVHARADSAIATWAADESQDLGETEWLWKWERTFYFWILVTLHDWILDDIWVALSAICVLNVSSANASRSILIGHMYLVHSIDFRSSEAKVAGWVSFRLRTSQESRRNATLLGSWGGPHHVRPE